jgi:PKHD-type hydroxylase
MKINELNVWNFYHTFKKDPVHLYAFCDEVFTKKECEDIIEIGKNFTSVAHTRNERADNYRNSEIAWLYPSTEYEWIFSRVSDVIYNLNNRFFGFDIQGLHEGIQFTKYNAPGGKYGKHIDCEIGTEVRKLSFTLQLSDPNHYEGGDLSLIPGDIPINMSREQGHVAIFPSYVLHEVTPVTKGTRYSLVSWVTGKPFR